MQWILLKSSKDKSLWTYVWRCIITHIYYVLVLPYKISINRAQYMAAAIRYELRATQDLLALFGGDLRLAVDSNQLMNKWAQYIPRPIHLNFIHWILGRHSILKHLALYDLMLWQKSLNFFVYKTNSRIHRRWCTGQTVWDIDKNFSLSRKQSYQRVAARISWWIPVMVGWRPCQCERIINHR